MQFLQLEWRMMFLSDNLVLDPRLLLNIDNRLMEVRDLVGANDIVADGGEA